MFKKWLSQTDIKKDFKELKEKSPFGKGSLAFIPNLLDSNARKIKGKSGLLFPQIFERFAWLAPTRSKPRRTYDEFKRDFSSEGEHTPYLVKTLLGYRKLGKRFKNFLRQFGKESDLFDSVLIKSFGEQATSPFALNILLQGKTLNIKNVGYGVSQSLPVIVELFARSPNNWFAIQQPEIHLHPKAQAALGDIIFSLATKEKKKFLIETHSDYIIDRFRLNYRKQEPKVRSQVLFFERTKNQNRVHSIEIGKHGEYSEKQPKGFREFFIKEELKLLGIK
jgi:predicted ATPase